MSFSNGISFRPTALAECTSVTDGQMDILRYSNIYHSSWSRFQQCCLKTDKFLMGLWHKVGG